MLYIINQIKECYVRDEKGHKLRDPRTASDFLKDSQAVEEGIDVWRIKSVRPFRRSGDAHKSIKGDISVIYLKNDEEKKGAVELHVIGNWKQIIGEVNELRRGIKTSQVDTQL